MFQLPIVLSRQLGLSFESLAKFYDCTPMTWVCGTEITVIIASGAAAPPPPMQKREPHDLQRHFATSFINFIGSTVDFHSMISKL
jgi:hypothetical protein